MDLTLNQIFGDGSSQSSQSIIIPKFGRTSPEAIFAGIIARAYANFQGNLTDESGNVIGDQQGNVTYDNRALYPLIDIEQWRVVYAENRIKHTFIYSQYEGIE